MLFRNIFELLLLGSLTVTTALTSPDNKDNLQGSLQFSLVKLLARLLYKKGELVTVLRQDASGKSIGLGTVYIKASASLNF